MTPTDPGDLDRILQRIIIVRERIDAEMDALEHEVRAAREAGASWAQIGEAMARDRTTAWHYWHNQRGVP